MESIFQEINLVINLINVLSVIMISIQIDVVFVLKEKYITGAIILQKNMNAAIRIQGPLSLSPSHYHLIVL